MSGHHPWPPTSKDQEPAWMDELQAAYTRIAELEEQVEAWQPVRDRIQQSERLMAFDYPTAILMLVAELEKELFLEKASWAMCIRRRTQVIRSMMDPLERLAGIRSHLPYTYTADIDWLCDVAAAAAAVDDRHYREHRCFAGDSLYDLHERLYARDRSTSRDHGQA